MGPDIPQTNSLDDAHMNMRHAAAAVVLALASTGCVSIRYGDSETEARLRMFQPIPGKSSLYVCREAAMLVGAGNKATAMIDGTPIGTLKPLHFAHAVVEPGMHQVYVKRNPGRASGILKIDTRPDEIAFVWVGMTGWGLGVLTVDYFANREEAERCVRNAKYVMRSE